jgi:prepilin-type N-terminal cleavage/methylation domain-containing protein
VSSLVARLRGRLTGQGGFTLVEMIVVTIILGVVLAAVQTTLIMTNKTVGQNATRVDQTQQAKVAVDSMTRTLRTAVLPSQLNGTCASCNAAAFIQGTKNSVQFYANINNDSNAIGPSRVSYVVNANGELVETIQPPNAHAANDFNYTYCTPGPGCIVSTRVLARGVPTGLAVFTYYDHAGNVMTSSTLSATDLAQVDSIDVVVQVKSAPGVTPPATTMVTRVTLPNADAIAQASPSP